MQNQFLRSFLLTLLIAASNTTWANAGPVTGRVIDPDARAVPGAVVFILQDTIILGSATTDAGGGFTLQTPDNGRFEIRVATYGFNARPLQLAGESGTRDVGTIQLSVSAQTESVLVTAAATEVPLSTTPSSVTVITGRELVAAQVESLHDVLRFVPGITVASSGGRGALTSVFPRGGESDYSLVLIDGVPANAFGGGFDFAHLPAVNVDRLEIVRGPQSALYGSNAIGAVVRVITKRGGPPAGQASFEGGSFGTTRASAASSGSLGSFEWGASADRLASDGLNGDVSAAGETIRNDDYERNLLSGSAGWRGRFDGAGIRGDIRYQTDERGFPGPFGSNPGGFFDGINDVSRGTNDRWLAALSAISPFYGRLRALAVVTHGHTDSSFESRFGGSESSSRRTTARGQADMMLGDWLVGSAGVELLRERAGSTFITASMAREVPVERSIAGLFGEARSNPIPALFVTAGLRIERITRNALPGDPDAFSPRPDFADETVVSVNPKIAAAWILRTAESREQTKLRGSFGTGIRPPDAFEIAFTDNPGLKPERSRSFDFGVEQSLARGTVLLESTAFFNDYDDLIVAVGSFQGSSTFRTDNISNARARGLEVAATSRIRWSMGTRADLQTRIGYTLLDTEILAVDQGSGAPPPFAPGDALLRRPKHQFAFDASLEVGRLTGFLQGGGRSRVRDVEPSLGTFGGIFQSDGYSVWNAGASWRVVDQAYVFGRINNLFDREYEEVLGFPALPRGFFVGVRVAASR